MSRIIAGACFGLGLATLPQLASAEMETTLGFYGTAGLVEMPTADMMPDAELSVTYSEFATASNVAVSFQFLPQLNLNYRIQKLTSFGSISSTYDGSWDLNYQILPEGEVYPAVLIGFRDFLATGRTASQYIVATKTLADQLKVTAGIGWGRLSDSDEIQTDFSQSGGDFRWDEYFDGPEGYFGGLEWQTPVEGLTLKAEYSSDSYVQENKNGINTAFDRESDYNFGVEYKSRLNLIFGAYYLYGSEFGFRISTTLNPKRGRPQGYVVPSPLPIQARDQSARSDLSWLDDPDVETVAAEALRRTLAKDGITVRKIKLTGREVQIIVSSNRLQPAAQTYGRVARALTYVMPESVETFVIGVQGGTMDTAQMTMQRTDLERFELSPNGVQQSARTFELSDVPADLQGFTEFPRSYPRFNWSVRPFLRVIFFSSGDQPAARAGLQGSAGLNLSDRLSFGASVRVPILDGTTQSNTSDRENVGPDDSVYFTELELTLTRLSADYVSKVTNNIYTKFNAGVLTSQFIGVAGEVVWKPADQRWGIGFDINSVRLRESDTFFDTIGDNIVSGHISGYYSARNGFEYQINAGRFLDEDWGARFEVDRTFDNGWVVGVFAAATDVAPVEFGDGRFQKGFSIQIPVGWAIGTQTRRSIGSRIASTSGNGGARLNTPGSDLFSTVSRFQTDNVSGTWGTFWQ
ncbi:MAG: YjbH domain-containing protein [Pseudomonadota bacterium]